MLNLIEILQMNSEATPHRLTKHHTKHSWSEELESNGDHDYNDDIDDYRIYDYMHHHDIANHDDVADHHSDVFDDHDCDDANEDHDAVADDHDNVADDHDDVANSHDIADHHCNVDDHCQGGDVGHDQDGHNQDKIGNHNDSGDVDHDHDDHGHNVDNNNEHDVLIAEQATVAYQVRTSYFF